MSREQLVIKSTFADLPIEKFLFKDFYFEDIDAEPGRYIPANKEQTDKYWELKAIIYKEMTGKK